MTCGFEHLQEARKRVASYVCTSTDEQTTNNQLAELRAVASRAWIIVREFVDQGVSGAKDRDQRPTFKRLCKAARHRECDLIAVWSVDRLGRSLQHLMGFLATSTRRGWISTCISKASIPVASTKPLRRHCDSRSG
jgi:DNA invertase Pin-like site-specific DNA recombinase